MGKISVGGGLVIRQIMFLVLILAFGVSALLAASSLRDQAHELLTAPPQNMAAIAGLVAASADRLMTNVFIGTAFAAFLILGVSMPVMHKTLSQPFKRLAAQMSELAAGNMSVQISDTNRTDEIGTIARGLAIVRDAVKNNNQLMAELKTREDREAQLLREASVRARVEDFSEELTNTVARLGDMTKRMMQRRIR